MAIDYIKEAKDLAIEVLEAGLSGVTVFDSKTLPQTQLPTVLIRKIGNQDFNYLDGSRQSVESQLRVEIRAATLAERGRLEAEVHEILIATQRVMERTLFYEGVDPDLTGLEGSDVAYRATFQYRMRE